jgi:hypothetical protein
MKPRVYIAGPISKGDLKSNLDMARQAGFALMKAGYAPLVPHLTCYMGGDNPEALPADTKHEDWLGIDLPWVAVCDAILRLPGESKGADAEVKCAEDNNIPVVYIAEWNDTQLQAAIDRLALLPLRGEPRYEKALHDTLMLHRRKAADYGTKDDLFKNIKASQEFGIPAWKAALIRLNDKVQRLKSLCTNGRLQNESASDSFRDIAAYAIIADILYAEENKS